MNEVILKISSVIANSSLANPTVITTTLPHGIRSGVSVTIEGHTGSTPSINGTHVATRISSTQFSIPVNVTVGSTGGRVFARREYEPGNLEWGDIVNARDSAEASVYDMTGEFRPALDAEAIIEEDGVERFRGFVDRAEEKGRTPFGSPITTRVSLADFNAYPENVLVTATIPAGTLKSHLQVLVSYLSAAPYSITLSGSQANGPDINLQAHNFRKLSEVLTDLTTLSGGWIWNITSGRVLSMTLPSIATPTAAFNISDGDERIDGDLTVIRSRERYANRVWVRAGTGAEVNDRFETFTTGVHGTDLGNFTFYPFTPAAVSFIEQPTVINDHGTVKVIGAPGTTNNGVQWEWTFYWPGSGSGVAIRPAIAHNDLVYGNQAGGRTIGVANRGMPYYNTFRDQWYGNGYTGPSDGFRWYWGGLVNARGRTLPPHTVFVNGTAVQVGVYGTANDMLGTPWDWVWRDSDPPLLGHRQALTALTAVDDVTVYSLAPFELIVQAPLTTSEPTAEQTTYGLREELIEAPNVFTNADAYALANAWLQRRLIRPLGLRYKTIHGYLAAGTVQTIVAATRNVSGNFLIVEAKSRVREADARTEREITLVDNVTYINTWRDEFAQWITGQQLSGSSTMLTISGGGSGGGGGGSTVAGKVFALSMREDGSVSSPTPTWVAASNMQARIDTVERGSTTATAYVRMRALDAGISVTARVYNATLGAVVGGPTSAITSTSWTWVAIPVTLTAGTQYYELQLLPSVANALVVGIGWIE